MRTAFLGVAVSVAIASAGRAEETSSETRWYGWQIILADAVGVALVAGGAKLSSALAIAGGVTTLALGSPLIHAAHHAPRDAGVSFLVRVVPFGASLALFYLLRSDYCGEGCGELAIPVFGLIGSAAGAVCDWIFLSTETPEAHVSLAPIRPADGRRGSGLALTLRF